MVNAVPRHSVLKINLAKPEINKQINKRCRQPWHYRSRNEHKCTADFWQHYKTTHILYLGAATRCSFPSSSPCCSLCLSLLKMMFCQFNSHYSNVFINIYGAFPDREEGEECGGGQQRLSIPTSQVMKIIQRNN